MAVSQPAGSSPLVTLDMPAALSTRVINALKADPRTIDVRALAPHFYSLAAMMLELFEEDELADVTTDAFKKRAADIADQANNPRGALGEGAEFLRGLDESERQCRRSAAMNVLMCC
ncbi:MAG: DNA replication complex GINS protein PSF3 [Terriglobus roseus]|nr:DNA replication complex GINS protein PSF3 [Terriglobus roseus]